MAKSNAMTTKQEEPSTCPPKTTDTDRGKIGSGNSGSDQAEGSGSDEAEQDDYPDKLISLDEQKRGEPLPPGEMPQGLEEERRGHSMDSQDEDEARSQEIPLGRDEKVHGIDDV